MSKEIYVRFNREDLEKICRTQNNPSCRYCLKLEKDLIRCNLVEPRHFKMLDKTYKSFICCLATQNPCTDCKDKSRCLDCSKACEYVQAIYNELTREF